MAPKLTDAPRLPAGWQPSKKGRLEAGYRFKDFLAAMRFLNEVAEVAERRVHHPDFAVHYNEVRFEVWSHDVDGVTARDYGLVDEISKLADKHKAKAL